VAHSGPIDRFTLEQHLAQAREHIAIGEKNIARQTEIVADLERDGHDVTAARQLLAQFEELQALHIADRNRLEKELASTFE
jgi:arginine repressor